MRIEQRAKEPESDLAREGEKEARREKGDREGRKKADSSRQAIVG